MSAANLDAVKKKYKFKEIAVATWRDPSLSVLSARGNISPDVTGRPYIPTYKVKYNPLPEPTDDEDSSIEGEQDSASPNEPAPEPENVETQVDNTEAHVSVPEALEPEQNGESVELPPEASIGLEPETTLDAQVNSNEEAPIPESADSPEHGSVEVPQSHDEVVDDTKTIDPDNGETVIVDEGEAGESRSPLESVPELSEVVPQPESAMDPEPADDAPSDEPVDERRVSFAPGTPEPKPTSRKKKAAKGAKGKKKRIAVPLDEVPADILAMIDSSFDGIPPPPPPPPAPKAPGESDDLPLVDGIEHRSIQGEQDAPLPDGEISLDPPETDELKSKETLPSEGVVDEPALPESQEADDVPPADSLPPNDVEEKSIPPDDAQIDEETQDLVHVEDGPVVPDLPPQDSVDTLTIRPIETEPEMPSKKKDSKSSKDKSKKKSSKSRSKDMSPPLSGLGIDISPPPVPEVDDSLKDSPPVIGDIPAPSQDSEPDPGSSALNLPEQIDTGAQVEHSEDTQSEDQEQLPPEPVLSDAPDAASENAHENDVGAQVQEDSPSQQIDDVVDDTETTEKSDGAEVDSETPAISGEETDGQELSPTDVISSPADSGVELEDAEKAFADGGEEVGEAFVEKPDLEREGLLEGDAETPVSKDEQTSAPDFEASNEKALEVAPEDDVQPLEALEDQASIESESTTVEESSEQIPAVDVEATEPDCESKEDPAVESPSESLAVDESTEIASTVPDAAPAGEGDSSPPDEPEGEPMSEPKVDEVPPEGPPSDAKAEANELELLQPDPPAEEAEPDVTKSIEEVIIDDVAVPDTPVSNEQMTTDDGPAAPPSPNLSKTSSSRSRESKNAHWERKHKENALKDVFEDSTKVLTRSKGGKDEVRVRGRSHKSRRLSSTEEDEARRRRRALRKAEDAARLVEEERKKLEEDRERRIRREERRAARKAEAEVEEKIRRLREEADKIRASRVDDEARRKRHRERDRDREPAVSHLHRETKDSGPSLKLPSLVLPKALGLASGQSYKGRPDRHVEEVQAAAPAKHREETLPRESAKERTKEESAHPSSSSGSKSQHKHRQHHRSETDRPSRTSKESDRRPRRPVVEEERPKSFLGMLRRL